MIAPDAPVPHDFPLPALTEGCRIPEIFLIGAAKSGTTSLADMLAQHPGIALGTIKEPNFFSHHASFSRGLNWYAELYKDVPAGTKALDASTGYTRMPQNPGTAERIHHYAPNAKLIYLLRHPIERAYSHFLHRWLKECHPGEPFTMSFEEYVKIDPICLDSSDYRLQLQEYLQFFPASSMLCVFTDDLRNSPETVLRRIAQFIGLDDQEMVSEQKTSNRNRTDRYVESRVRIAITGRINSLPGARFVKRLVPKRLREAAYRSLRKMPIGKRAEEMFTAPPLSDAERRWLIEHFRESNEWLGRFAGRDLSHWDQ